MAATETLGASFSIDITALKAGLAQANRLIRESNSEFKAAAAGMDDWSSSQAGLEAKLKSLNTVAEVQGKKVGALKEEYRRMISDGVDPASAAAVTLRTKINNEEAALAKTQQEIKKYTSAMESMSDSSDDSASASQKLRDEISKQESSLKGLKDKYASIVLEQGKESRAAQDAAREISDLSEELKANKKKLNDAEGAADDLTDSFDETANAAESAADGGFTIMKGALADLVADGINAAVDAFGELLTATDKASGNFAAKTGTAAEEMGKYNEAIQAVYANNFGESMEDVADAMAEIAQQTKETDPSKLQKMTENALALRETFDWDVNETMRASNMLMEQFGISSDEAFNMLAQGAQNGLDKNGDLLDSINEYAVHYQQQGYSAEEFFNSLANGTEAGTFSVDKLGDAMKEFGVRTKDTANSTTEGFELLGLDADLMRQKFAAGGDSAREATQQTLEALYGLDDQVVQNQAGVDLFGTMWEDLGKEGVNALMQVDGSISTTKDSMEEINNVKYDNIEDAFEGMKRSIEVGLLPVVNEIAPYIKDFFQWVSDHSTGVTIALGAIGTAFAAWKVVSIIKGITDAFKAWEIATKLTTIAQGALNAIMALNPATLIVVGIMALIGVFILLWNKCDAFREFWQNLWDGIQSVFGSVVDWITEKLSVFGEWFSNLWSGTVEWFQNLWGGIAQWFSDFVITPIMNFFSPIAEFFSNLWNGIVDGLKNIFGTIAQWLYDNVIVPVMNFFSPIVDFFGGIFTGIYDFLSTAIENIIGIAKGCWEIISAVWAVVSDWFNKNVITPVKDFFAKMWDGIKTAAKTAWDGIKNIWNVVTGWFNNTIITPLKNFFTKMWDGIKTAASNAWNGIKGVWNVVTGWFTNTIIEPVKRVFSGLWDRLKSGASNAWSGIKSVFGSVANFFGDVFGKAWKKVKDVFSTGGKIFDGIKDGIANAFKTIVNSLIRGINRVVSVPFNAINAALRKIRDINILGISPFKGKIKEFNVPSIPLLAKGGVVRGATTAVIGEDGAEAVVPLEKNREWITAVAAEMAKQFGGGNQPVNVYQTNNYSQAHSRFELYKSKQATSAAVRLAMARG